MPSFSPECRAFLLDVARTAQVAAVRADGRPHVAPVWFYLDGDALIFTTGETTVKGRNIARDGRVCICVDDERPPFAYVQSRA
ncbi:MAG TPA: pyridoxamine 5'-phosphate oxidase family protein [Ktedonobacteraceae bacterium]|jgi:PPOX class probable F420-dependent enzyme|nr:pyridoxamine 5'-phosphate oxidase family protein [Ktedonobacteraceae bacterium]